MTLYAAMLATQRKLGSPLAVNITPSAISDVDSCPYSSVSVSANPSGGAGGYTYAWDWVAGGTGLTINNPTSASTIISISSGIRSGTLRCIVTDSDTDTASDSISVDMECS